VKAATLHFADQGLSSNLALDIADGAAHDPAALDCLRREELGQPGVGQVGVRHMKHVHTLALQG
jgi:hypothetical protein